MAVYRARWVCPFDGVPKFRDFGRKPEAEAFTARPRAVPINAQIKLLSEVRA